VHLENKLKWATVQLISEVTILSGTCYCLFQSEAHGCPDCGKRYSTSSNLARHRQTHRSLGDKKARRCPHCDKVYVSMPAFSMHVRTHNQGCKCPYCGKCFSRPWLLQGHIRTHTGISPVSSILRTQENNFRWRCRWICLMLENLYLNGRVNQLRADSDVRTHFTLYHTS
jgi:uncharacterized Zn-finger protein